MESIFTSFIALVEETGKPYDLGKIRQAFEMANDAHAGQTRATGEPYVLHPIETAEILLGLGMDTDTIVAALLHDVVEDTQVTIAEVEKAFGKDIARLVDGVTKLGKIPFTSREQQQAENIRKMLLAMAQDVRVIIIKLADRLHNMRTIEVMPDQKRRDKALETMEVYAPLAHRLGITGVKEELEDLSLKYLDPVAYEEIENQLNMRKDERNAFLERIKEKLYNRLHDEHENMQIDGRVKSIYGIYRKVYAQGRAFEEIYDIYAVRIIVDSVFECYNILGIIHDVFRPIPNRFKDYISTPKQNMYQSLQTTVIDNTEGIPFEVQIRTWDMHHTAEYGVAAHWKYKIGISGKDTLEDRLAWVRQLLEAQKESDDAEDLVKSIKSDIAPEEVFVFTPKGDVIRLPVGSTVIDFGYAIHSEVGNQMTGAKVDGRIVPLDFKVKTGMIVEVMTSKGHGPSRDWMNIVRTSEARSKIRAWYKRERRDENIQEGRQDFEREMRRNLISVPPEELEAFILDVAKRQHFHSLDEFYAAIGYGGISLHRIMPRVKEEFIKNYRTNDTDKIEKAIQKPKRPRKASGGVIVEGMDSFLVKFAKCCNPLPGDAIVGFITRGYGVSIHKKDCLNVQSSSANPENEGRWVKAHWAKSVNETFKSTIEIITNDRQGVLADVSVALANMRIPIHALNAKELKDKTGVIQVNMSINDLEQLQNIINSLKRIQGISEIKRTST